MKVSYRSLIFLIFLFVCFFCLLYLSGKNCISIPDGKWERGKCKQCSIYECSDPLPPLPPPPDPKGCYKISFKSIDRFICNMEPG